MAHRGTSKQTFSSIAVGVGATSVGYIQQCFGATHIVVRARNGSTGNTCALTSLGSIDGVSDSVAASPSMIPLAGPGATNTAGGYIDALALVLGSVVIPCPYPFLHLFAACAGGATTVSFDVWPVFLQTSADTPLGFPIS